MLYSTSPDIKDGHVHDVELEGSGDGVTSEGGSPSHSHEVKDKKVMPFVSTDYVSSHPGALEQTGEGAEDSKEVESGFAEHAVTNNRAADLVERYLTWASGGSPLHEDGGHDYSPTAYDVEYRDYPDPIKRYLPAAVRLVRSDPQGRLLEFSNKDQFRQQVASTAMQILQLSSQDGGFVPDVASGMNAKDKGQAGSTEPTTGPAKTESLHEQDLRHDVGAARRRGIDHARIMKTESVEGDERYMLRLDGTTFGDLTQAGVVTTLVGAGYEPDDAMQMSQAAKKYGDSTYLTAYTYNFDIEN